MKPNRLAIALGMLATALAYFLSTGLRHFWPLTWIAPIPVLVLALECSLPPSAVIAFVAFVLGALGIVPYLASLAPAGVVAVALVVPALGFTLAVLAQRHVLRRWPHWAGVAVFPATWVSYEYLLSLVSPHGTFGSLAYTQTDLVPVIQVASVTGMWGISFLLMLVPAGLAAAWHLRTQQGRALASALVPIGLVMLVLVFGWARIAWARTEPSLTVGLAAIDRTVDRFDTDQRDVALAVLRSYAGRISELANRGADVVVLPEKFVGVVPAYETDARAVLSEAARRHHVTVVAGLNLVGRTPARNTAVVFGPDGQLLAEYNKAYPVPGLEAGYLRGSTPGLFSNEGAAQGVAICKDMDFPSWLRAYSRAGTRIVFVPAWDFVRDGRLHSRMAILRGVEGGFAVARSAQEGLVTISDHLGRVFAEDTSSRDADVLVSGRVPLGPGLTVYARFGDWFAVLSLALLLAILGSAARRRG